VLQLSIAGGIAGTVSRSVLRKVSNSLEGRGCGRLVLGANHPYTLSSSAALIGWQTE